MSGEQKVGAHPAAAQMAHGVRPALLNKLQIGFHSGGPHALHQILGHPALAARRTRNIDHLGKRAAQVVGRDVTRGLGKIRMHHVNVYVLAVPRSAV